MLVVRFLLLLSAATAAVADVVVDGSQALLYGLGGEPVLVSVHFTCIKSFLKHSLDRTGNAV